MAPVVTSIYVILNCNKIQNEDMLVPPNAGLRGKMSLEWRQREREYVFVYSVVSRHLHTTCQVLRGEKKVIRVNKDAGVEP